MTAAPRLGIPEEAAGVTSSPATPAPVYVFVETEDMSQQWLEGEMIAGDRLEDSSWDLDGVFVVRTEEGTIRLQGWSCIVAVLDDPPVSLAPADLAEPRQELSGTRTVR
jgi:hypothetical protein